MKMDEEQMEGLCLPLMKWKQEAFAMGERDVPPQLAIQFDGKEELEPVPDWILSKAYRKTGTVGGAVSLVLRGIAEGWSEFTKFRMVMLVTDGYMRSGVQDEDMPERGAMGEDFRSNPATDVIECMTLTVATDDLVGGYDMALAQMPYVVTDGGVMDFKETKYILDSDDVGGDVVDQLRAVLNAVSG